MLTDKHIFDALLIHVTAFQVQLSSNCQLRIEGNTRKEILRIHSKSKNKQHILVLDVIASYPLISKILLPVDTVVNFK